MALFGFNKKRDDEKQVPACTCNGAGKTHAAETVESTCCENAKDGICCIKVLGSGCKNCHMQFENAQTAVNAMGLSVDVEYVTDMEQVMAYGVMSMPALVVNEKVVSMGKILKATDVENLLHKLGF